MLRAGVLVFLDALLPGGHYVLSMARRTRHPGTKRNFSSRFDSIVVSRLKAGVFPETRNHP